MADDESSSMIENQQIRKKNNLNHEGSKCSSIIKPTIFGIFMFLLGVLISSEYRKLNSSELNCDGGGGGNTVNHEQILTLVGAASGKTFSGSKKFTFPDSKIINFELEIESKSNNDNKNLPHQDCKSWCVVTTIFEPSEAILKQAGVGSDWCIVIVGDKKSPKDFSVPSSTLSKVIYLGEKEQLEYSKKYFSSFLNLLPWNSFGRKNLGYLYSIHHGADIIWDFDDDNIFTGDEFLFANMRQHLETSSKKQTIQVVIPEEHKHQAYNPYIKYGKAKLDHIVWPRGFPLSQIQNTSSYDTTLKKSSLKKNKVALVQSLANHDPDVDAIYRLIFPPRFYFESIIIREGDDKNDDDSSSTTKLLESQVLLQIPKNVLTPLNAQACLFTKPGFFMMYLPITVNGRVADIWRGYIGVRLLWEVNLVALFSPPAVVQKRNAHNYIADFNSEIPLYEKSEALVTFLSIWKPLGKNGKPYTKLESLLQDLYIEMYERDYLGIDDVFLIQKWILSLRSAGYKFPQLVIS